MKGVGKPLQLPNGVCGKGASIPGSEKTSAKELGISLGCLTGTGNAPLGGAQQRTGLFVL